MNFPFTLVLEHPPIDLPTMFQVTMAFDFFELEADATDNEGLVKENILVDVLECSPTVTIIKVTPAETMPYRRLALHTLNMLQALSRRVLGGKAKVVRLTWEIDKTGVASDLRGMLHKIS